MTTVYIVLLILSALAFFAAFVGVAVDHAAPRRSWGPVNFIALGLLLWVLVPLIQEIRAR